MRDGGGGGIYILLIVSRDITVTWKNTFVAFPKTELLLKKEKLFNQEFSYFKYLLYLFLNSKSFIDLDSSKKRQTWLFRTFKVLGTICTMYSSQKHQTEIKMYKSTAVLNLKRFNSVYFYCLHRPFHPPSPPWGFILKNTFTLWWSHFVVYLVVPRENIIQFQRVIFAVNKN